jgi:phage repressor protein C with HTH and peptisase S24 domain
MRTLGQRIELTLEKRRMSQHALAKEVGITQPSINAIIKGKAKGTKHIYKIATTLRVSPEWLLYEEGTGPDDSQGFAASARGTSAGTPPRPAPSSTVLLETLPILGTAEGGPDGLLEWNGDVIDRIPRPPYLADAKDAYALYVTGTSMEPRYRQGELIYVHPGRPATPGSFVVVQFHKDGATPMPSALVKQFVRRDDRQVVLHQLNPDKDLKIQIAQVKAVHRIVGSSES